VGAYCGGRPPTAPLTFYPLHYLDTCTASMFSLAIAALKIHDVDDDDDDDKNGFIVIIVEGKDGGTVQ